METKVETRLPIRAGTSGSFDVFRTPEQGHTKSCMFAAVKAALENTRDHAESDTDFVSLLQDNAPLVWARMYLAEGMTTCSCEPIWESFVSLTKGYVVEYGAPHITDYAGIEAAVDLACWMIDNAAKAHVVVLLAEAWGVVA